MNNIAALTPGYNVPSSRFRVRQYIKGLSQDGITVHEFPARLYDNKIPGALGKIRQRYIFPVSWSYEFIKVLMRIPDGVSSHFFDGTWLNRTFYNAVSLDFILKRPLILDIDDAIWLNNRKKIEKLARYSDLIFAGNSFIANWASSLNKNVYVIPTAVDVENYTPSKNKKSDKFIVGWSGTAANQKYLLEIEESVACFIERNPKVKLQILSDSCPVLKQIPRDRIEFIKWDPDIEPIIIAGFDVGLMPLDDSDWSQGKCSYKMLQYMSSGIPVIVSPIGMNKELLSLAQIGFGANTLHEWTDCLQIIFSDTEQAQKMGSQGRLLVENKYSKSYIGQTISNIFHSL